MLDIHNYDIELIEEEILMKYANNPCNYADCDCLLSLRKDMINQRALAHQEEILPDIIAFNEKLREALKEMYDRAHRLWDSTKEQKDYGEDIELTAKCFLGNDYPKLHPVQSDDRQELWAAISDSRWNRIYDDGVTFPLRFPQDLDDSFDTFIGMDCLPPNWNEGLDQELTKDLHLISAFQHLFDHTKFAITDFIYVREFETEINIEIWKKEMI